jgi:dinuclear metal center YbgI/SA1388 family protein
MINVAAIGEFLEAFAPLELAADWDNVGLLLGDESSPVKRIMTCLTITPASTNEAISESADLIVSHHPILFRPVKTLNSKTEEGRMLLALAKAGVAVYSPHTAFDNTLGGINETIATRLGLTDLHPLRASDGNGNCKLVVFVPKADLANVSNALFAVGAGHIGHYKECSFRTKGTGTFFGSEAANPTIGQIGRREEVSEWRLEVVCPVNRVDGIVSALREAHSYEEPAFDLYPLHPLKSSTRGEGKIGRLAQPQLLGSLAEAIKVAFNTKLIQWVGDGNKSIEKLAIVCGSGGDFWKDAVKEGADALLTGEARFHDCLAAEAHGLSLILMGHYASERFAVVYLANHIQQRWPELKVWASRSEQDPLRSS